MSSTDGQTRRTFLRRTGAAGGAGLGGTVWAVVGGTVWATGRAAARARRGRPRVPIEHVIISCQENRSFDHYFVYAPKVQARGFGPPPGFVQPDAAGVGHAPFRSTDLTTPDPPHSWNAVHEQWNGGRVGGLYPSSPARVGGGGPAGLYFTR